MKIILTGGAGFIGSCTLSRLNSIGIEDVIVVDAVKDPSSVPNLMGKKFKEYVGRDDLLPRLEKGQMNDVDLIIHLGACADTTQMDRQFLAQNNVSYSQRLARWALAQGKRFHYASSASIYGDGKNGYSDADESHPAYAALNPYGESKLEFDRWLIRENLPSKVVGYRYFNVFGPNEYHKGDMSSMVFKAYNQIRSTGRVQLFATTRDGFENGSEERDFVYVKDVLDVMTFFLEHPGRNGIFNVGTGKARSFKHLAEAVFAALGKTPDIAYVPMPPALRRQYQYFTQADLSKLRQAGYDRPFLPLEVSVADYVTRHLMNKTPYF